MNLVLVFKLAAFSGFAACVLYVAFALVRVTTFRARRSPVSTYQPPVTIAKPICGMESGLQDNLRSYFNQDYPDYQVVFERMIRTTRRWPRSAVS